MMTDADNEAALCSARERAMPECENCGCICDPAGAGGVCLCDLACDFCTHYDVPERSHPRTFARLELDGVRHPVEVYTLDGVSVGVCRGVRRVDRDPTEAARKVVRAVMATVDHDAGATLHVERPQVTVRDDDIVRTHDEAAQLLKYAAPGATVVIEPIEREHMPNGKRFTVVLDAAPHHATSAAEIYTLPCRGEPIQRRVSALCREAWEALRRHRRTV